MAVHITRDDILVVKGDPKKLKCVPLFVGQVCISVNKTDPKKFKYFISYGLTPNDWRMIPADSIEYKTDTDINIKNVKEALDRLFYEDLEFNFKITSGQMRYGDNINDTLPVLPAEPDKTEIYVEKGFTLTRLDLNWSYLNRVNYKNTVVKHMVDGVERSTPTEGIYNYSCIYSTNIIDDTEVKLEVDDLMYETTEDIVKDNEIVEEVVKITKRYEKSVFVKFLNKVFWGVAQSPVPEKHSNPDIEYYDSNFVNNLGNGELLPKINETIEVTSNFKEYIYYAVPEELVKGNKLIFNHGCLDGGFESVGILSVTNAANSTSNYHLYKSEQHNLGQTKIKIRQEEI